MKAHLLNSGRRLAPAAAASHVTSCCRVQNALRHQQHRPGLGQAPGLGGPTARVWVGSRVAPAHKLRPSRGEQLVAKSGSAMMSAVGFDLLTFLGSTVIVVPLFKQLKISPVLGFLFSGVVLQQLGWVPAAGADLRGVSWSGLCHTAHVDLKSMPWPRERSACKRPPAAAHWQEQVQHLSVARVAAHRVLHLVRWGMVSSACEAGGSAWAAAFVRPGSMKLL